MTTTIIEEDTQILVSPTVLTPENAIALFQGENAVEQIKSVLAMVDTAVEEADKDVTTKKGRDEIRSLAFKIARTKTTLDSVGKAQVDEIKARTSSIDRLRKACRDHLDALKAKVMQPVVDFEAREAKRVDAHERELSRIQALGVVVVGTALDTLTLRREELDGYKIDSLEEFSERGQEIIATAQEKIAMAIEAEEAAQAQRKEIERLKEIEAREQKRLADERIEQERIAKEQAAAEQAAAQQEAKTEDVPRGTISFTAPAQHSAPAPQPSEVEKPDTGPVLAAVRAADEIVSRQEPVAADKIAINAQRALVDVCGLESHDAQLVILAIAEGKIPHVHINPYR